MGFNIDPAGTAASAVAKDVSAFDKFLIVLSIVNLALFIWATVAPVSFVICMKKLQYAVVKIIAWVNADAIERKRIEHRAKAAATIYAGLLQNAEILKGFKIVEEVLFIAGIGWDGDNTCLFNLDISDRSMTVTQDDLDKIYAVLSRYFGCLPGKWTLDNVAIADSRGTAIRMQFVFLDTQTDVDAYVKAKAEAEHGKPVIVDKSDKDFE